MSPVPQTVFGIEGVGLFGQGMGGVSPARPGLSPNIWFDAPLMAMVIDPGLGIYVKDDLTWVGATGLPYELIGTNGTMTPVASSPYGEMLINCPAVDNNEAHVTWGNDVTGLIKCSADKAWWFEARIKMNQIVAEYGVLVGLLQQGASADDILADNTMIFTATLDYIGFQIVEAAANPAPNWRTIMQLAARAAVSETAAPASVSYVKLGMKSVPNAAGTLATIYFFVDGVQLATSTTSADTNFPLDQVLIPHWSAKTGSGAAVSMTVDWWAGAQLR